MGNICWGIPIQCLYQPILRQFIEDINCLNYFFRCHYVVVLHEIRWDGATVDPEFILGPPDRLSLPFLKGVQKATKPCSNSYYSIICTGLYHYIQHPNRELFHYFMFLWTFTTHYTQLLDAAELKLDSHDALIWHLHWRRVDKTDFWSQFKLCIPTNTEWMKRK